MKPRKTWIVLLVVLAVLLIALLGAKPVYNLYRDISFGWEERSEQEHIVKAYAETMGISYGEYPVRLIELFERNPETEGFVLNYPFRKNKKADISHVERETVPLFLQWDPMWGYKSYGGDFLANTGCGPTCLAMAGYYLTGDTNMTPDRIAKFAGAGTLVPITGFANAVVSPAIDTKAEGLVLGIGAKIFTVAGPVLLYGTVAGAVYGVLYWIYTIL